MEEATKLYRQYLEDARSLAKVGQDANTLQKANVFAQIAAAIAATGYVEPHAFTEEAPEPVEEKPTPNVVSMPATPRTVTGKASLERTVPPKKEPAVDPDIEVKAYLASDAFKALDNVSKEEKDKRELRYAYLKKEYGSLKMSQLPQEAFPYVVPEKGIMNDFRKYLASWNADTDVWMTKVAAEASKNRATGIGELTVTEYLDTLIPALFHVNYILSFAQDQRADLMDVLAMVSKGDVKKIEDIRLGEASFLHMSIDSVIDGTWEAMEQVS